MAIIIPKHVHVSAPFKRRAANAIRKAVTWVEHGTQGAVWSAERADPGVRRPDCRDPAQTSQMPVAERPGATGRSSTSLELRSILAKPQAREASLPRAVEPLVRNLGRPEALVFGRAPFGEEPRWTRLRAKALSPESERL